jgi:predicted transcriptional regulator
MVPNAEIVFDHDIRRMVYNHILAYPGESFITLRNIFNLKNGTLRYHLEYLEKADRILSDLENGKRCYYPLNNEIEVSKLFENNPRSSKFSTIQQKILSTIKYNPDITQKNLVTKTGLSRFTISYNMKKFIDMGLVKKTYSEKFVHYEYITNESLKHEVLLRLTKKLLSKEIDERSFLELRDKLV